jgi:hypothetical protein
VCFWFVSGEGAGGAQTHSIGGLAWPSVVVGGPQWPLPPAWESSGNRGSLRRENGAISGGWKTDFRWSGRRENRIGLVGNCALSRACGNREIGKSRGWVNGDRDCRECRIDRAARPLACCLTLTCCRLISQPTILFRICVLQSA